jgi:hypothetical protein
MPASGRSPPAAPGQMRSFAGSAAAAWRPTFFRESPLRSSCSVPTLVSFALAQMRVRRGRRFLRHIAIQQLGWPALALRFARKRRISLKLYVAISQERETETPKTVSERPRAPNP